MHRFILSLLALLMPMVGLGGILTTQPLSFTSEFGDTISMSTSELVPGAPFDVLVNISIGADATPRVFNLVETAQAILDDGVPNGEKLLWYFFLRVPQGDGWRVTLAASPERWLVVGGETVRLLGPTMIPTGEMGTMAQVSGQFTLDNSPTPEPATWMLGLMALPLMLAGRFRRRRLGSTSQM
jgi:hypothetical protein